MNRVLLVSASALAAINIWTGAPLLAAWVRLADGGRQPAESMGAVGVVVVLGVLAFEVWFFFFAGSALPSQ